MAPGSSSRVLPTRSKPSTFIDPLMDGSACARDLPFLQQLQVNTIRVYSVNSSLNHDDCMNAFSQAGIYTIIDLALPGNGSIDRNSPTWTTSLLDQYIETINVFNKYDNVLAYNVGNEVITDPTQTGAAAFIKAAARDVRAYLNSIKSSALIGYAAIDGDDNWVLPLAEYLSCDPSGANSGSSAIDLFGLNNYEWCGDASPSVYSTKNGDFAGYNVAAYFSEYGCVKQPPRLWSEVPTIFSPPMSDIWSGGVAFSYFPAESNDGQFAMVTIDGNTVTPNDDFERLKEQYGALVGYPTWQPAWGFGFHLCRWGYRDANETREQVTKMREANIPLEVMWNDIDLYHAVRDFTTEPVSFPADEMKAFIGDLTANQQHYIPIVDAAIAKVVNASDVVRTTSTDIVDVQLSGSTQYDPYTRGNELDIWTKNPDGSEYLGRSRPGYAVFPDWFANDTGAYWTEALRNWSRAGVNYSGIWLDVNEPTSLCIGSCGTGANLSEATVQSPPALVTEYPEGYNASIWGPSGNITINGTLTFGNDSLVAHIHAKRGLGASGEPSVDLNDPPYTLHNAYGVLSNNKVSTNATHANGAVELDTHNLWGLMEEKATHLSLLELRPGKRPFMISRSTFPSSGRWTGHWLGDNISKWQYMYLSIQGVLQFQLFQIPFARDTNHQPSEARVLRACGRGLVVLIAGLNRPAGT
ncbi:hypothetical protein NUW54_g10719 [Trametes sanguinea]|uniref:Uncharacterized protein n=1 Tax=Trametes sanguinea TaxID=158606 RepID=A0ACC1NU76_9APHY|nr:hypothetical protein NUW54_g10719 [Trametes sanguinea]